MGNSNIMTNAKLVVTGFIIPMVKLVMDINEEYPQLKYEIKRRFSEMKALPD